MSTGKVTNEQAKYANIGIDDFRKAVNTVNPKNKGYVRFVPDGKGGVKIAKVNNNIDFNISWRSNINAANNRTMREKFAMAMANDLRWADPKTVEKLVDSITNVPKNPEGKRTDALSRKELQKAFKEYDKMMNTPIGRMNMVENLLRKTAERCKLNGTEDCVKVLKKKYLIIPPELGDLSKLWENDPDKTSLVPKMDELTFKTYLIELEKLCDEAVKRAEIENLMKGKADLYTGPKALDNTFGLHLSQEETGQLRGALLHFLILKGLVPQQGEGGVVGTGGMVFEKFMKDVLPALFKQNVENIREWSNGENGDMNLQMEANFSFEAIMEEAEKFMKGARQFIDNPPKDEIKSTGDAMLDKVVANGREMVNGARQTAITSAMQKDSVKLIENANISQEEGKRIYDDLQGAREAYVAEGLLGTFTKNFLAERGIGEAVADNKLLGDAYHNTMEAIYKDTHMLGLGIKIQNGTVKKNPQTGKKEQVDEGMKGYVHDMENAINEIAAGKDGLDMTLVSKLMSFTMANLTNRKVAIVANHLGVDLKLDKASEEKDKELLRATAEAYFSFEKNVGKAINKAKTGFEKLVRTQFKKGLIDQNTCETMILNANSKFAQSHKEVLKGFFLKSPIADANEGKKLLDRIFKGQLQEAISELNNDLALNSLGRAIGVQEKGVLRDVMGLVHEAMSQPGMNQVKLGVDGIITEKDARATLQAGELKRLYSTTLATMLKKLPKVDGHLTVTEDFVKKVKEEFNSKVMSLVKKIAQHEENYIKQCNDQLNNMLTTNIEGGRGSFRGYNEGDKPITESETKKLAKELTDEVLRAKASQLKSNILEILDAPGSFDKKAIENLGTLTIRDDGPEKTTLVIGIVADDREQMVKDFLADKNSLDKIKQSVLEGKVFGKGGVLENVYKGPYSEGEILISKATNTVIERVKKMPLIYATGDKEALVKRLAEEVDKAAQSFAKKWAKFRTDFIRQTGPIDADFSSLGVKTLEDARQWALVELANRKDFNELDMKVALGYYHKLLQDHLDGKISNAKTKFDEYMTKVTAVYENAMEELGDTLDIAKKAIGLSATPEAQKYMEDVIIPKMKQRIEYQIYQNPDNFTEDKLDARDKELMLNFVYVTQNVFNATDYHLPKALVGLIKQAGADVLLEDKVETEAAMNDLKTWLKSPEGHKLRAEAEKAMLDQIMEYGPALKEHPEDFAPIGPSKPNGPRNAVADFRFAARDLLRGHTAQLLYSVFDNEKVGEVRTAFSKWLDSHGLSRFEDYRKTTAEERIMAKFDERVKILQENALKGGENEPILTPAFIKEIDYLIDKEGTEMLLAEVKTKFLNAMLDELAAKDEAIMFNPKDPRFATLPTYLQETVKKNYKDLESAISLKISSVLGDYDTKDGLDNLKQAIKGLDEETVRMKIIVDTLIAVEDCINRYNLEKESPTLVADFTHTLERHLIKSVISEAKANEYFKNGFIDVMSHEKVPEKKREALNKELNRISDCYKVALGMCLSNCRQHNATPEALHNTFQKVTIDFIDEVNADKGWKANVLPVLKSLEKNI
ncbi:MAG: hypothetical protein J6X49_04320 [Victivallales bacterium]|nr:hypothetical protein [Victivallales bacterium]